MPASAPDVYRSAFCDGLRPDAALKVSEWADQHRFLSMRSSAEPGRFRCSRTPYIREPIDALSPSSPVEEVVLMFAAQLGKTEAGNNWVGFIVDQAPGPTMYVQPTVDLAKRASRQRLDPLFEDSPRLRAKIADKRSRDSGNTVLMKSFPGGDLVLTGANSAVGLRSMPIRNLFLDEIDAYPGDAEGEGDPVLLAQRGTRTFARRKLLKTSTPTIKGRSRIERDYLRGDQRVFLVPCPECGEFQRLLWKNVRWEKDDPTTAVYGCEFCGVAIEEHQKTAMLAGGYWHAQNPDASPKIRSYHLSALYSPLGWFSWEECVALFLEAKGRPDTLRVFVNTVLGETWAEEADAPDWELLFLRRERYKIGTVPLGGVILVAGVDVQGDRLEVEVVAYGKGRESWSVDYLVLAGDTDSGPNDEPWASLSRVLDTSWPTEAGPSIQISRMSVDAAYRPQPAYAWIRQKSVARVMAIRGREGFPTLVGLPKATEVRAGGKRLRRGVKLWPVGIDVAKAELYGQLRIKAPAGAEPGEFPDGFVHFPMYAQEWFEQLTAEQLVTRILRGYRKYRWEKTRERNEALDCRVYARAAAATLGIDRLTDKEWATLAANLGGLAKRRKRKRTAAPQGWLD